MKTYLADFKFNHEDMNHSDTMRYRNNPILTSELLYNIGWALHALNQRFDSGSVVLFSEVCFSKDMWDATNYARLWPEAHYPEVDAILQDALGHLGEAHYMIDHVYHNAVDVTPKTMPRAYQSITVEVRAALTFIREAIMLIDNYVDDTLGGKHEDDPS
jgi:hypothetical protein